MFLNRIVKIYKSLFPKNSLPIAFLPLLIGFLIAPELVEIRDVLVNLIWVNLLFLFSSYIHSNKLYNVFLSLFFVFGIVEIGHWLIVKGPVTITSLLVISNTNLEEGVGFFDIKGSWLLLLLIPYTIVYILGIKEKLNKESFNKFKKLGLVLCLASFVFILENAFHQRFVRKAIPQLPKTMVSFINKRNLYKEALGKKKDNLIQAKSLLPNKKQTCILILGESGSRNHMSLYGYNRKTTPKLDKRDDIVVYTDVISPHSNTINSILSILSESNLENNIPFDQSIDFFDVFHAADYKSYWISNQSPVGIWDNLITIFANKANHTKFVNLASNSSFEATLKSSYDSKVLDPFVESLNDSENKKIIVLHLLGNHTKYSKRYPNEFAVFEGTDKTSNIIADYDNSILYNDFIVNTILDKISMYSENNPDEFISTIYLSDHGENVYDYKGKVGHDYSQIIPKVNVEIPFILWKSKNYETEFEGRKFKIDSIYNNTPYITDDLFHSIMDLNYIESNIFDKTRSLFSKTYNAKRERILSDKENYDLK